MSTHVGWNLLLPEVFSVIINYWHTDTTNLRFKNPYLLHHLSLLITDGLLPQYIEKNAGLAKKEVHVIGTENWLASRCEFADCKSYLFFFSQYRLLCIIATAWTIFQWALYVINHFSAYGIMPASIYLSFTYRWKKNDRRHQALTICSFFFFYLNWSKNGIEDPKSKWNFGGTKKCGKGDNSLKSHLDFWKHFWFVF